MTIWPRSKFARGVFLAGLALVGLGALCNPVFVAALFSPDGQLQPSTQAQVWRVAMGIALAGIAICLLALESARPIELAGIRRMRSLAGRHPAAVSILFGCALAVGLLAITEYGFGFLNRMRDAHAGFEGMGKIDPPAIPGATFGYRLEPMTSYRMFLRQHGVTAYDIQFNTDENGRRAYSDVVSQEERRPLLLFGCSFMFGHGLPDEETLPGILARIAPEYRPYNYALSGYGPQQLLAHVDSQELAAEFSGTQPTAVYGFISDHVDRVIGTMRVYNGWGAHFPRYELSPNGRLIHVGSFQDNRPWLSTLYSLLGRSATCKYFGVDLPARFTDQHVRLTSEIIAAARDRFMETFPDGRFYVLVYPGPDLVSHGVRPLTPQIMRYLRERNVDVLDYSTLWDPREAGNTIPGDEHPSGKQNNVIAERLLADLRSHAR